MGNINTNLRAGTSLDARLNGVRNELIAALDNAPEFLSRKDICHLTGMSITTLWRLGKSGDFPEPIRLSPRSVKWPRAVIYDWLTSKMQEAGHAAAS